MPRALLLAAAFTLSGALGSACAADADAELAALSGESAEHGTEWRDAFLSFSRHAFFDDEIAKVKGMHATAAIVLHYGGNDWSRAQVEGQKAGVQGPGDRRGCGDRRGIQA